MPKTDGIPWRVDRRPSLLEWAKDLTSASHLRSEPFASVLQERVVVMTGILGRSVNAYVNEWADYDLAGLRSGHVVEEIATDLPL